MNLNNYYLKAPRVVQEMSLSLAGYAIKKQRYSESFFKKYREVYNRDKMSRSEFLSYQEERVAKVLKNAYQYSPFYKGLFESCNLNIKSSDPLGELKKLPIISKNRIRESVSPIGETDSLIKCKTSGSTGSGLHFFETPEANNERWAVWWRYRSWHEISFNDWCGYFGGKRIVPSRENKVFWRTNYPGRQIMFSSYHINENTAFSYVQKIRESKLTWLHGFPSVLSLLSTYILENNIDVGDSVRIITIGSESLLPHQKKVIEKAFGIKVRQHYGLVESVANISECEHGSLHIDEDFAYVEAIENEETNSYRLVGTNLSNLAFPFIRYDTQDQISNITYGCKCKRESRVVETIDGRREDYILLPNGNKIGRLGQIFKNYTSIREAQIVQHEVNFIELKIVKNENFHSEEAEKIITELKDMLGNEMRIQITYESAIQRTKNGKLRFVISKINGI